MKLWSSLFGRKIPIVETKAVDLDPLMWSAINGGWGLQTKSGSNVSINSSLMNMPFYRGVIALAEGVAQLPIQIYKTLGDGRGSELAIDHPLYEVLHYQANNLQDAFQFWRTMLMHMVATGNAVAYKNVVNGETRELLPIRPECVQINIEPQFYNRVYWLTFEQGGFATVGQKEVFHLQGPSWAAYRGLDPTVVGREALGLAQATEETHSRFHKNGTRPSGILQTEQRLSEDQVKSLREQWNINFSGTQNTGGTPILGGGLDWKQISQTGVDSEHLATRKHQIEEVARLLGIFPIMLGHAGDQSPTFASADAFIEAHVRFSLQPLFKTVIKAVETQLLTKDERRAGFHCKIDSSELMRGSLKDRTDYYKAGLGTNSSPGWLKPNEVRADDGWNPDDDPNMDEVWQPSSMTPSGLAPDGSTSETEPQPILPTDGPNGE